MGTMQLAVKRMFLRRASKPRRLSLLPAVLAAVCLTLTLALSATPARAEVKTGTIGKGCSYALDDSGKLTIYPTNGVSGEMAPVGIVWEDASPIEDTIRSVVIERGVSAPEDSSALFKGLRRMETLDLSGLDTSRVTDMGGMFSGCASLPSLDLSGWDTSRVEGMWGMFFGCSSLSSLAVGEGCGGVLSADRHTALPAGVGGWGWHSERDKRWLTLSELSSSRQGVADTYTAPEAWRSLVSPQAAQTSP